MGDRARDLLGAGMFLALSIYAGVTSYGYGLWSWGEPGSGLFPFIVSVLLGLAALIDIVRAEPPSAGRGGEGGPANIRTLLLYLVALGAFGLGFELLGHLVATAVVFLFLLLVVERVAWPRALWVTAASALGSYLLFERLLAVPLPRGTMW